MKETVAAPIPTLEERISLLERMVTDLILSVNNLTVFGEAIVRGIRRAAEELEDEKAGDNA